MSTTIGQIPHFDISTTNFSPIGNIYPTFEGGKIVIAYGSSDGQSRKRLALRRYIYIHLHGVFSFVSSYKGVRNRKVLPSYVGDTKDINDRFDLYGELVSSETEPLFITQNLLKDLFLYPNFQDYFFIEGSHSCRMGDPNPTGPKPNFFEIYRYGKLSKDNIAQIIAVKNNLIASREVI